MKHRRCDDSFEECFREGEKPLGYTSSKSRTLF